MPPFLKLYHTQVTLHWVHCWANTDIFVKQNVYSTELNATTAIGHTHTKRKKKERKKQER